MFLTIDALCSYLCLEIIGSRDITPETKGYCMLRNPKEDVYYQIELEYPADIPVREDYREIFVELTNLWAGKTQEQKKRAERFFLLFDDISLGKILLILFSHARTEKKRELRPYLGRLIWKTEGKRIVLCETKVLGMDKDDVRCLTLLDYRLHEHSEYDFVVASLLRDSLRAIHHGKNTFSTSLVYEGRTYCRTDWEFEIEECSNEEPFTRWEQ